MSKVNKNKEKFRKHQVYCPTLLQKIKGRASLIPRISTTFSFTVPTIHGGA